MSFDVSWAAFNGVRKRDVLAAAGFRDTGEIDEANEAPFSCSELPTGWTILWANDSTYAYNHIGTLSKNHAVLSLIIQDYIPTSLASFHVRREQMWSIYHEGHEGNLDLTITGAAPPQTAEIRDRQLARQRSETHSPSVDYMYEVPIAVTESVCGYRHDRWRYAWGRPLFTVAVPTHG